MHFWADPSRCRLVGRARRRAVGGPRTLAPVVAGCWLLLPSRPSARLHADSSDAVTTHRRSAALRRQVPCPSHTSLCPLQSASYDKSSSSDQASVLRRDGGQVPQNRNPGKINIDPYRKFLFAVCILYIRYCSIMRLPSHSSLAVPVILNFGLYGQTATESGSRA